MKHIWSIAVKELRGYFNSAVALIFLATFLAVVLYTFFFVDRFFARNLADVRPLFEWLPLLLIFLVSALTMRQWSEEQKTGTLEILLTLPVPVHRLVLGKFVGGLILVAVALGLTLGLPLTVAQIGDLDWGPVIGGYLAALLLASTYLSIGLCVSSVTENQIVALISTVVVGSLLYLPGTDAVTSLVGIDTAEVLRKLGTGSRFESIARGVLDLRDLAYYASLVAVFLTLNTVLLMAKRWGSGERTQNVRFNARTAVALVALNALALNLWITPVASARIDLTESNSYSLSEPTEDILASLEEPLVIRGFFSDKIHEQVDPLVPQIRDILTEYKIEGGSKVRLDFTDPTKGDEELAEELLRSYNIESLPVRSFSRHEEWIINAYFHVLIAYGDQFEVLSFENLTRVEFDGEGEAMVLLGNIEYEVTKAIRKVIYGFQSLEAMFASVSGKVVLEGYISRGDLPENLASIAGTLDSVAEELKSLVGDKFEYRTIEPESEDERDELARRYGIEPLTMWNAGKISYIYFHLLVRVGDRVAFVSLPYNQEEPTKADLREAITNALKRAAPGFIHVVGMVVPQAGPPQQMSGHMPPQQTPAAQKFSGLEQMLSGTYEVRQVDLSSGEVSSDVEVLILAGPEDLVPKEIMAIDQFLMRGGAVIALVGKYRPRPQFWTNPLLSTVNTGLDALLEHYGVTLGDKLVADTSSDETFMKLGLKVVQLRYPFFVQIPSQNMSQAGLLTSGLDTATLHFATPVTWTQPEPEEGEEPLEVEDTVLMTSTADAWLHEGRLVRPDLATYPGVGFAKPQAEGEDQTGTFPLAVALTGTFESMFAGSKPKNTGDETVDKLLKRSPPDARLVVVGSSSFASDEVLGPASQFGARTPENNLRFVHNLVDWAVEDTDLLSIRAVQTAANLDVDGDAQDKWEWMNYAFAFFGLFLVIGLSRVMPKPVIDLAAARQMARRSPAVAKDSAKDKGAAKEVDKSSGDEAKADKSAGKKSDEEADKSAGKKSGEEADKSAGKKSGDDEAAKAADNSSDDSDDEEEAT